MEDISMVLRRQQRFFLSNITKNLTFRRQQLKILKDAIKANEKQILRALKRDLNKSEFESYETEIGIVLSEIRYMEKNLETLAKVKRVKTPLEHFPSKSRIYQEPYGVALIISPWNYPFQLAFAPMIAAIAAGNCAVIKPSEEAYFTSKVIHKIISTNFKSEYLYVIEGGRDVSEALVRQNFDFIFFTGGAITGKKVLKAASENLTPVVLELGGKSPCIVDKTADIKLAAKRIVWGKFLNAGQTCVAPDYILVHKDVKELLLKHMCRYIQKFYGAKPHNNHDFPKIINDRHFERLLSCLNDGEIRWGGKSNQESRKLEPTILDEVSKNSRVMQEEIFGPILPVITFDAIKSTVSFINSRPKPLALYLFTKSKQNSAYILSHTSFGGGCINDTVVHLANIHLPFGGIGQSGMGHYHGRAGYETFSHKKSILVKSNQMDIWLRYPYFHGQIKLLKLFLK